MTQETFKTVFIRKWIIIIFGLFSFVQLRAQEIELLSTDNFLSELINRYQKDFGINFSFSDKDIRGVKISYQKRTLAINEFVELVEAQTSLILKRLADNNYVFIKKSETITVCGQVVDANSLEPIVAASIQIKNSGKGVISDAYGRFTLKILERDHLVIEHIGYGIRELSAIDFTKEDDCPTIVLEESSELLSEVLITDYLTKGIVKNIDGSVSISPKNLKIMPGLTEPDVMQSLQLLPGINSPNENATALSIRGGSSDHNLYIWDGIKMYHTGHLFDQISAFNPYITDNVKIYRSGTSAKYGDRISGIIDISTDNKIPEKITGGMGSNLINADMFLKLPLSKNVGLIVSGRRSITDFVQTQPFNQIVERVFQLDSLTSLIADEEDFDLLDRNFGSYFYDATGKLIIQASKKDKIQFSSLFIKTVIEKITNAKRIEQDPNTSVSMDTNTISNFGLSFNWERQHSKKFSTLTKGYFSDYTNDELSESFVAFEGDEFEGTRIRSNANSLKDISAEFLTNYRIGPYQNLTTGYQFSHNEVFVDRDVYNFGGILNTHTLFSEYGFKNDKVLINIGARVSRLNRIERTFFEPRLFSSYQLTKHSRITLTGEVKNQLLNQLYVFPGGTSFGPSINPWTIGFRPLESGLASFPTLPLRNKQVTLGWIYSRRGWTLDLEAYFKDLDGISSYGDNFSTRRYYTGTATIYGLDFLLKKRYRNYRIWLSYSLSKNDVTFPDFQKESFPGGSDKRHAFNFSQTLQIKDFELALGWTYSTGRPYTGVESDVFEGDNSDINFEVLSPNNSRVPDYHRLDASLVYRFKWANEENKNAMFGISLLNVYDRANLINRETTVRSEPTSDLGFVATELEEFSLGFTPNVVFRINF